MHRHLGPNRLPGDWEGTVAAGRHTVVADCMIAGLVVEMGRCIVGEAGRRRRERGQCRHMIGVFHL